MDEVLINRLHVNATIGKDCWGRTRPQPLEISLRLVRHGGLGIAAENDDVNHTIDYGKMTKSLLASIATKPDFNSLQKFAEYVKAHCESNASCDVYLSVNAPKRLLQGAGYTVEFQESGWKVRVSDLAVHCIIGVRDAERLSMQMVMVDLVFSGDIFLTDEETSNLVTHLLQDLQTSSFLTLEAFVLYTCKTVFLKSDRLNEIKVTAKKPSAIPFASSSGVTMTRKRTQLKKE